jgi:hypothetical protein
MFGRRDEYRHQFSDGEKAILRDLQMSGGDSPTPALLPPVRCRDTLEGYSEGKLIVFSDVKRR